MKDTSGPTIFVCGIAGVGKTYLVRAATSALPGAISWSAGEIIGQARRVADPETLRTLPADDLVGSQELLIGGFQARRREAPSPLVLLDAHSVIDTDRGLFEIPVDVIRRLAPSGLMHVEDNAQAILERRLADHGRPRPVRSLSELVEYQNRSVRCCQHYRDALRIPLVVVRSGDVEIFVKSVELLRNGEVPLYQSAS
jgi:adenylate kinase